MIWVHRFQKEFQKEFQRGKIRDQMIRRIDSWGLSILREDKMEYKILLSEKCLLYLSSLSVALECKI